MSGANLSQIQFAGSATCAVRRSEVDDATFARLIGRDASQTSDPSDTASAKAPFGSEPQGRRQADGRRFICGHPDRDPITANALQTPLFDLLTTDHSDRLKIATSNLEIRFDVRGMPLLLMTSPVAGSTSIPSASIRSARCRGMSPSIPTPATSRPPSSPPRSPGRIRLSSPVRCRGDSLFRTAM